jgi:DNA-binding CsgD family transcriptional regulator
LVAEEDISRLLLLLYEGAATPARFQVFLNELAQVVNAKGAVVREHTFRVNMTLQLQTWNFSETVGYSAEALSAYSKYFWQKDMYLQRCLERFRSADCGVSQSLISESELKSTEVYAGYLRPFDIGPMTWVKLAERADCHASISLVRSNAAPYFDESELKLLTALTPHLRQALRLSRSLHDLQTANTMLSHGADGMEIAICMVRQDRTVLRMTQGADPLLAAQEGIWQKDGRLKVASDREQRSLDALIAGACQTGAGHGMGQAVRIRSQAAGKATIHSWTAQAGGALLITRKPPLRPLQVVVSPFCPGSLLNEPQATALIQFSDPYSVPRSRAAVLRDLYALTPAEARLADLLLQGLDVNQVAEQMRTTLATTRFQLKRVLAKTATRRQSELMRLMLSLPGQ